MPDMRGLSLVTYTYNDHQSVMELLEYSKSFHIPIREVMVVDDGSAIPFTLREDSAFSFQILRQPRNMGPGQAKRAGLGAATAPVIFSLDADIRPHAKWAFSSLELLRDTTVGLVGSLISPAKNASYLGKALYRTRPALGEVNEAAFVAGGCMVLRKSAWDAVGGLEDFTGRAFEDFHLCRKMRQAGYKVVLNTLFPVYEKRHLHRTAWCGRHAAYELEPVAAIVEKYGLARYLADQEPYLRLALDDFAVSGDPVLAYTFLLKLAYMVLSLAETRRVFFSSEIVAEMQHYLSAYPSLSALLEDDLRRMGVHVERNVAGESGILAGMFAGLADAGILPALENLWVARYREEDASVSFDSHYCEAATIR
jgi:GT2 family glycosyltransferase